MTTEGAKYIAAAVIAAVVLWIGYDAYQESQKVWALKPCKQSQEGEVRPWKDQLLTCRAFEDGNVWLGY